MRFRLLSVLLIGAIACAGSTAAPEGAGESLRAAETAFAEAMAKRDLSAFEAFVADDAVFINGGKPLRGKAAIVAHWKKFFDKPAAPFSWKPEIVEVTQSGNLGYSEGPVSDPKGEVTARYYSTWRTDADGEWKVVFDNGYDVCKCPGP